MSAPLSPVAEVIFSPKTTADLDKSLGDIEELLLDADNAAGCHSQQGQHTSSQKSLTANDDSKNYYMGQDHSTLNAVHMHVHDNAKLPTFNLPVDRSNATLGLQIPAPRGRRSLGAKRSRQSMTKDSSTLNCPLSPLPLLNTDQSTPQLDLETSDAIDEIIRLSENDMNLSELFLDHDDRTGAALAYSSSIGRPVPHVHSASSLEEEVSSASAVAKNVMSAQKDRPTLPYKRKRPLPIPSPPREKTMADAFATAAAIASTSSPGETAAVEAALSATATIAPPMTSNSADPKLKPRNLAPTNQLITQPPGNKIAVGPIGTRPAPPQAKSLAPVYPAGYPYPVAPHSSAHEKTKGSIAYATAQRSKFGFGGNHKVPSVPAPPPARTGAPVARTGAPVARIPPRPPGVVVGKPPYAMMPRGPPHILPPLPKAMPKDVGSTIAYERKKQRAKDARIRLNDAIEELAVAIDLAGAQSKERFNYLTNNGKPSGGTAVSVGGNNPTISKQNHLASLMSNTIKEASSAKKWDRPSFVALSAAMLMSLNAQCEGLMKEVARLKGAANNKQAGPDAVPSCVQLTTSSGESNSDATLRDCGNSNESHSSEPAAKKAKSESPAAEEEQRRCDVVRNVTDTPKLVQRIASFLDPSSLCRCLCVAKSWSKQNIFQDQDLWLNHCIKRFGATAVRKWQDFEDDEDDKQKSASPNLDLYCRMAERNVKPPCSLEGSAFMGGSNLDGLVSGWVTLMERSNGETSRSVMLNQGSEGKRSYGPIPVVELRILLQNTGYSKGVISFPNQQFACDASTRRKGEKMMEICSDDRFKKRVLHVEKRGREVVSQSKSLGEEMCSLGLFEYAILSVHIHARGCSTAAKFCNRAKKLQLLVSINGTTRPLVIPFYSLNGHP